MTGFNVMYSDEMEVVGKMLKFLNTKVLDSGVLPGEFPIVSNGWLIGHISLSDADEYSFFPKKKVKKFKDPYQ